MDSEPACRFFFRQLGGAIVGALTAVLAGAFATPLLHADTGLVVDPVAPAEVNSTVDMAGDFPRRPIRIIVYTGPGGLIDYTARKFADVARKYVDQPFVVINKPGAGGIVALDELAQMPADGYAVAAVTKSNISRLIATGREDLFDRLDWFALVMEDPECVITNRNNPVHTWPQVLEDAFNLEGDQIWPGPAIGGLDHVFALKLWDKTGMQARWIPYNSGGQAMAALLGGMGVAYVGNPRDVRGRDDLIVAAVSAPSRLDVLPDVPTFREFGIEGLDDEFMWRGFAFRDGVPEAVRQWWDDLFSKVSQDPAWRDEWYPDGIRTVHIRAKDFRAIVDRDREEFRYYLQQIGIVRAEPEEPSALQVMASPLGLKLLAIALLVLNGGFAVVLFRSARHRARMGESLIVSAVASVGVILLLVTATFPPPNKVDLVGAAGVPHLWLYLLLPLCLYQAVAVWSNRQAGADGAPSVLLTGVITLLALYIGLMPVLGYFVSTALFLPAALYVVGYRRLLSVAVATGLWLLFSYFVFYRLLYVDLPSGYLMAALLS